MNFSLFTHKAFLILTAVLVLISIKALILSVLGRIFDLTKLQTLGFAFALSQGSEFAFVLFDYASKTKVISNDSASFCTLVVALSMLATPFYCLSTIGLLYLNL